MIGNTLPDLTPLLTRLEYSTQRAAYASIAAALITASGRPHSIKEVKSLMRDIEFSMNPQPGLGSYEAWKKEFDPEKPFV